MKNTTFTITISQNNVIKKVFESVESDGEAFGWMLRNQGQSVDWALRHGGWKVEQRNDQTGEIDNWKPYSGLNR